MKDLSGEFVMLRLLGDNLGAVVNGCESSQLSLIFYQATIVKQIYLNVQN